MYESIGGAPAPITLGVAAGDPVSSIFTADDDAGRAHGDLTTALSALRTADRPRQHRERHVLPRREHQGIRPESGLPSRGPERRRHLRAGSVAHQPAPDAQLRLALGVQRRGRQHQRCLQRPDDRQICFGPSTAPFQPGALNGVADPQIYLRPSPYKSDFNNPAPNLGVAWNPESPEVARQAARAERVSAPTSA